MVAQGASVGTRSRLVPDSAEAFCELTDPYRRALLGRFGLPAELAA